MFFYPLVLFMMMIFVVSVLVLFFAVQIGVISYALDKIAIPSEAMFSLLLLSWVGSRVNMASR
jgi:type IV secretory pathway VirB3-like protein